MPDTNRGLSLLAALGLFACTSSSFDTEVTARAAKGGGGAPATFVRVNQVGYPAGGPKRAYVMSSTDAAGASFAVRAGNTVVASGTLGPRLGSWSQTYAFVHAVDFSQVS